MSIRILVPQQVSNFTEDARHFEMSGGSDDGMRRSYGHTVTETYSFIFDDEQAVDEGNYLYDLRVIMDNDDCVHNIDMTDGEDRIERNFDFIFRTLRKRGIRILNPTFVEVKVEYDFDDKLATISFGGKIRLTNDGTELVSATDLIARVSECDSSKKTMVVARAIRDTGTLHESYAVPVNTIPDELFDQVKSIRFERINDLVESGVISREDIREAMIAFAARDDLYFNYLTIDGFEDVVLGLPAESRDIILRHCYQTPANIHLFRRFCPDRINWREVKLEDYIASDLDLLIQQKVDAYKQVQYDFIRQCMSKPELERKVVENAYLLCSRRLSMIVEELRTCTVSDFLVGLAKHKAEIVARGSGLSGFEYLDFSGVTREGYDACITLGSLVSPEFTLEIGLLAGVSEEELIRMLLDKRSSEHVNLMNYYLVNVYKKFNFGPWLRWTREQERRRHR